MNGSCWGQFLTAHKWFRANFEGLRDRASALRRRLLLRARVLRSRMKGFENLELCKASVA